MKCFIFTSGHSRNIPEICGADTLQDLIEHLRSSGVEEVYSELTGNDFNSVRPHLGTDWIAAYHHGLSRQDPLELREKGKAGGAPAALSLACGSKPWENITVFSGPGGAIQSVEANPSPENAGTNLCFSGLVWVNTESFLPEEPWKVPGASAFLLPGYWRRISGREDTLRAYYDVLSGELEPWGHSSVPENGRIVKSPLPDTCMCRGVLWLGENCTVGEDCELDNCVILDGSQIGNGARLRNCLVSEGSTVAPGTVRDDKYLTMLGEDDG